MSKTLIQFQWKILTSFFSSNFCHHPHIKIQSFSYKRKIVVMFSLSLDICWGKMKTSPTLKGNILKMKKLITAPTLEIRWVGVCLNKYIMYYILGRGEKIRSMNEKQKRKSYLKIPLLPSLTLCFSVSQEQYKLLIFYCSCKIFRSPCISFL